MPRYRKLHVKAIDSFDLAEAPDDLTRLLWLMLPLKTCREGRGIDAAGWLIGQYFPLRHDVCPDDVERAMSYFASRGMIARYRVAGRPYFQIANWSEYQGDTSREAQSTYPGPTDADSAGAVQPIAEPSQELVMSRSRSDANTNTDADTKTKTRANARRARLNFPPELENPEFTQAWSDWLVCNQQQGRPLTDTAKQAQLDEMAAWGVVDAIQGLRNATAGMWKKPYRPKSEQPHNGRPMTPYQQSMAAIDQVEAELAIEPEWQEVQSWQ